MGDKKTTFPTIPGDALYACAAELAFSRDHSPRQAEGTFRNCDRAVITATEVECAGRSERLGYGTRWGWRRRPRMPSFPLPLFSPWTGRGVKGSDRGAGDGSRGSGTPALWRRGCLLSPPVRGPRLAEVEFLSFLKANSQTVPVEREIRNFSFCPKPKRASGEDWVRPSRLLLRVGASRAPGPLLALARVGAGLEGPAEVPIDPNSHLGPQPN